VEVNVKVEKPGPNNPHNNAFFAEETLLRTEQEAQRDCNALSARHWIVSRISPFSPPMYLFINFFTCTSQIVDFIMEYPLIIGVE